MTDRPDPLSRPGPSLVNIAPPSCSQAEGDESGAPAAYANMNPALNSVTGQTPGNVQVLNVLDVPQATNTLEQFAMADVGLLEGIPGGMFDWGVYCSMHFGNKHEEFMWHRAMGNVLYSVQRIKHDRRERRWERRGRRGVAGSAVVMFGCILTCNTIT